MKDSPNVYRQGDVVWLTGSASGLGLHLTECFIQRGYSVIASDINITDLEACAQKRGWPSERVQIETLNVASEANWQAVYDRALQRWNHIDYLFNVAGVAKAGPATGITEADIDLHFDVNTKGVILGSHMVINDMIARGSGHIVNVASTAALVTAPGMSLYSASKFAVRAFTLALAAEVSRTGVAVTCFCPDSIETPMLDGLSKTEFGAMSFSGSRILTVEDVEECIFTKVIPDRPVEALLPLDRCALAKTANVFPGIAQTVVRQIRKQGVKKIKKRQQHSL